MQRHGRRAQTGLEGELRPKTERILVAAVAAIVRPLEGAPA
jgi:hypothetical protein